MYDEQDHLDDQLAELARSLRGNDVMLASTQLATLASELDSIMRREERALLSAHDRLERMARNPLAMVRDEHTSLRRLVALIAAALDRADGRSGLDAIGKLRSVLLVHVAKEEALQPLFQHAG